MLVVIFDVVRFIASKSKYFCELVKKSCDFLKWISWDVNKDLFSLIIANFEEEVK